MPPSIDESNVVYDRKVNVGRRVELECPVHGIPPPSIQWMVNAQPVENFSNMRWAVYKSFCLRDYLLNGFSVC